MNSFMQVFGTVKDFDDGALYIEAETLTREQAAAKFSLYEEREVKAEWLTQSRFRFGFAPEWSEDRRAGWFSPAEGKGSKLVWSFDRCQAWKRSGMA